MQRDNVYFIDVGSAIEIFIGTPSLAVLYILLCTGSETSRFRNSLEVMPALFAYISK